MKVQAFLWPYHSETKVGQLGVRVEGSEPRETHLVSH